MKRLRYVNGVDVMLMMPSSGSWVLGKVTGFSEYVEACERWYRVKLRDGRTFFASPRLVRLAHPPATRLQ